MKKAIKIISGVVAGILAVVSIGGYTTYAVRGNLKNTALSQETQTALGAADGALAHGATTRVMSANLLVHYASWGGTPAKPRAKLFTELLEVYRPNVVGLQEVSDEWFCCLNRNLPDGYRFLFPFTTGLFVNMTAMIYDSAAVTLVDSGKDVYTEGDNPRLRRVVWGVFEQKSNGKRFAVTSTHFDLIRENKEEAQFEIMTAQTEEMVQLVNQLAEKYQCPVFSTGDFNAMEDGSQNGDFDAPLIYEKLTESLADTKPLAAQKRSGEDQGLETPTYDHIFLKGQADVKAYQILSDPYVTPLSDHYPIFIDVTV